MTKIDIISGFLGAGKTTFIKKLIEDVFPGERLVLIENEFGEIGIDGGFLKDAGVEITEMNSGCICCTLVGDFSKALQKVLADYTPDRVIIEPSGVGKLSDVVKAIEGVKDEADIEIDGRITVVDGKKAKIYLKNFGEFFNNQVEHASTIVISRTQMMTDEKVEECVHMLREKNAEATIISTPWEELGKDAVLHALQHGAEIEGILEEHAHEHDDHEHHHHHDDECGAVMIMITTIITNMMRTAPADATIMTMNTIMITTMKSMSIIMNMMRTAPADAMTITTDTKDIIMQMKYLQAGARRLLISIQKKNWITC